MANQSLGWPLIFGRDLRLGEKKVEGLLITGATMTSETDDFDFSVFLPKVKSNSDLLDHTAPNEMPSGSKLPIEEKDWLRKIDPFNMFLYGMIAGFIATVIGAFIASFFLQLRYGGGESFVVGFLNAPASSQGPLRRVDPLHQCPLFYLSQGVAHIGRQNVPA
jgi:hypothetical protein